MRDFQLLTCVFVCHADEIGDCTLSAFTFGVLELTSLFRHIIVHAAVFEEVSLEVPWKLHVSFLSFSDLLSLFWKERKLFWSTDFFKKKNKQELKSLSSFPALSIIHKSRNIFQEEINGYQIQLPSIPFNKLIAALRTAENHLLRRMKVPKFLGSCLQRFHLQRLEC